MDATKKPHSLVGLRYTAGEGLPSVVLKASGIHADTVEREFSRNRGQHRVVREPQLAEALMRLPIDSAISPNTYSLVATLLLHVYSVEAHLKAEKNNGSD